MDGEKNSPSGRLLGEIDQDRENLFPQINKQCVSTSIKQSVKQATKCSEKCVRSPKVKLV